LVAFGIFEVLYAPSKALKEVIKNPRYIGPILVMVLFVIANLGFCYALLSKTYLDQTMPDASADLDKWTENASYWNSNALKANNTQQYISQQYIISKIYYGNKSIEFSLNHTSHVWMELNLTESLNCSGPEGYKNMTFRVKILKPQSLPSNISLYLFSLTKQDYFYKNITDKINNADTRNKVTFSLGQMQGWTPSTDKADWGNITGLRLEFRWSSEVNTTLLIDGLFFHGIYKSRMEIEGSSLALYSINAFMSFTIYWVLLGGMLYLVPKMFGVKTVWKPLLVAAGFILMAYFIRMIIFTFTFMASPEVYYPLSYLGGVSGECQEAYVQIYQSISLYYEMLWYFDKVFWVWIIALGAITIRLISEMPWVKSFIASTTSYLLYVILVPFLAPSAFPPPILL